MDQEHGETLARRLRVLRDAYEEGAPLVTDAEYDELVERLRGVVPDHAFFLEVGRARGKCSHTTPMLSLAKAYTIEEISKWARGVGGTAAHTFFVSPKFDGVACALTFREGAMVRALTRGDGTTGEDVTEHVRLMRLPDFDFEQLYELGATFKSDIEVRGELIMRISTFRDFFAQDYANPRNLVAGLVGRSDPDEVKEVLRHVSFIPYGVVMTTPQMTLLSALRSVCNGFEKLYPMEAVRAPELEEAIEAVKEAVTSSDFSYEADGLVIRVNEFDTYAAMGATAHHPRGAIALKFQGEGGQTVLRDVEWQTSRTGAVTPVAVFDAITLSGAALTRATLHNLDRFRALQLRARCTVEVTRRGGVIPHVERVVKYDQGAHTSAFAPPDRCPSCNDQLTSTDTLLLCVSHDCPAQLSRRLEHWAKVTGMLGWGPELVARASEDGALRTPADFYTHTIKSLTSMTEIGAGVAKNLVKEAQRTKTMPPATYLAAWGLPTVGRSAADSLIEAFGGVDKFVAWCCSTEVEQPFVQGMSPTRLHVIRKRARSLRSEMRACRKQIVFLEPKAPAAGPLSGMVFVFTGALADMEREEAQRQVVALGAGAPAALTMKTTHLVVGSGAKDAQRTKRDKAAKYNAKGASIKILTEDEFLDLLNQHTGDSP